MRVSGLDSNDDWTFGRGKANYKTGSEAIRQNVKTRLKSFANDYFLDTDANIDWIGILGRKNNQTEILNEIERVTLSTNGVMQITELGVDEISNRRAIIVVRFLTIFNDEILINAGVEV